MMIVVFRDEVQMIDQSKRLFKPWMRDCPGKQRCLKLSNPIQQLQSRLAEFGKNLIDATLVMPRFVSFPVAQVGGREFNRGSQVVVDSRHPQRLEVEQMSGMLLGRPPVFRLLH
jgi:hypothetical protein